MSEFNEVLDLGFVESERHTSQYLPNRVDPNRDVLVLAILGHVVVDDLLGDRLDFLGWHELVARLDDHGEDLADFVLLMRVQIAQNERVELKDEQVVSANQAGDESEHEQFDLILVVGLAELGEEALGEVLRVVKRVDRQKVGAGVHLVLSLLLALLGLNCSLQVGFLGFGELGAFVVLEQVLCVFIRRLAGLRLVLVVQNEEEPTGSRDDLGVAVHDTARPNGIHGFFIIPNTTLVELDHDIKRAFGRVFVRVLQQVEDEVLQLLVDSIVLRLLVQVFQVVHDAAVEELPQLLVLTAEELEEDGEDDCRLHCVLAAHDFEAGDQSHAHFWVQDGIVLLEQVEHFRRNEAGDLTVDARAVRHEAQVVHEVGLLLSGVQLEVLEFLHEDAVVYFKLLLVVVGLPLHSVLQLGQRHLLFVLVHRQRSAILFIHQVVHLRVFAALGRVRVELRASTSTSPLVCFDHGCESKF